VNCPLSLVLLHTIRTVRVVIVVVVRLGRLGNLETLETLGELLVATGVGGADQEQDEVVLALGERHLELGRESPLHSDLLDCVQLLGRALAHDKVFTWGQQESWSTSGKTVSEGTRERALTVLLGQVLLREERCDDRDVDLLVLVHLALELHIDNDRLAGGEVVLVLDLVRDLDRRDVVRKVGERLEAPVVHLQQLVAVRVFELEEVVDGFDAGGLALLDELGREAGQLSERRVGVPHRLHAHLAQLHRADRVQVTVRRHAVDAGGEEVQDLAEDERLVGSEIGGQRQAREVRLQEDVDLEMRRFVVDVGELDRHAVVHLPEELVLVMPDRDALEFGGRRNNLEETAELGLFRQRHREDVDRDIVDVVVRRDHAEVERRDVHLVLDRDRLRVLQVGESRLDQLGQVVAQMPVRRTLHVVVVRVRDESSVHPSPGQPVDSVPGGEQAASAKECAAKRFPLREKHALLVLDRLGDDLGVEVVVQRQVQMRFDRQALVEELLEELFPNLLQPEASQHCAVRE
jgi:hypothetical protein